MYFIINFYETLRILRDQEARQSFILSNNSGYNKTTYKMLH